MWHSFCYGNVVLLSCAAFRPFLLGPFCLDYDPACTSTRILQSNWAFTKLSLARVPGFLLVTVIGWGVHLIFATQEACLLDFEIWPATGSPCSSLIRPLHSFDAVAFPINGGGLGAKKKF